MEGLAITRAVHDRYRRVAPQSVERNRVRRPLRALDGQLRRVHRGLRLRIPRTQGAYRIRPAADARNFKAPFTAAEGWGTFQVRGSTSSVDIRWGRLCVNTIALATTKQVAEVRVNGKPVVSTSHAENGRLSITLSATATIQAGQTLEIRIS